MSGHIKILVCFKTVPDLDMLKNDDWIISENHSVDTSFIKKVLSSFDQNSLEMALKLTDMAKDLGLITQLTALTVGDESADIFLKNLYAVNFDTAIRINSENSLDLRFNPLAISSLINEYQQKIGQHDLIILSNQSDDGQNGQTAMLLAEQLGWPCITQVNDIHLTSTPDHIDVSSTQEITNLQQRVKLPIVLAIGNTPETLSLRIPTLKSKLNAAKKEITHYAISHFNLNESQLSEYNDKELVGLFRQHHDKKCIFIEGENAQEKARTLYENYLIERIMP